MNQHELYFEIDCCIIHLKNLQEDKQINKYNNIITALEDYKKEIRKTITNSIIDEPCIRCALRHLIYILSDEEQDQTIKQITQNLLEQMKSGGN